MTLLTVQTKARLQRAIWIQQGKIRMNKYALTREAPLDFKKENNDRRRTNEK